MELEFWSNGLRAVTDPVAGDGGDPEIVNVKVEFDEA